MVVTVEQNVATVLRLAHHNLHCVVFRAYFLIRGQPLSVQIKPAQRAPVIAHDDTIRVEHRNDLEDKVVAQVLGPLIFADKVL